jgi:Pregnancy-associated plasma protein-A
MKGFILFFTAILAVMFCLQVPALAADDFDVKANGKVIVNGIEYKNMAQYYRSDHFKIKGKRCIVKPSLRSNPAGLSNLLAAPSDCTTGETVIQSEYWPSQAFTIPVVFHIIYKKDGTGDIPDSRVINQVAVLNEDYRAIAGTLGGQGFDVKIQFELAGITRTENDKWFRDRGQESNYKNALAWDVNDYMNVYTNSASGYLGYAYYPQDSAGEWWDGITLLYSACGGRDEGSPPYNQGRTLTHEAGHYFGLQHTFEGGCSNTYTSGDLIVDTNAESTAHYDCVQTETCNSPDPIYNYMNYTDDLCMYEFTSEQGNRAVCSLVNYRPDLYNGSSQGVDMFVSDISMALLTRGKRDYAQATITIMDVEGAAVSGATVFVTWSGVVSDTDSGTTDSNGTVTINSPKTKSTGTFTVTVTDVTHASNTYVPSLNVETSDSISN